MSDETAFYSRPAPPRTLVRAAKAADELGIPRATVRAWTSTARERKLWPVGMDEEGVYVYDLADVRRLAGETRRRKRAKG